MMESILSDSAGEFRDRYYIWYFKERY